MLFFARFRLLLFIFAGCVAHANCQAAYPSAPTDAPPTVAIEIHYPATTGELVPGMSGSLIAYAIDADRVYRNVTASAAWSSSDPNLVTAASGRVIAHAAGEARVTAAHDGLSDSTPIFVRGGPLPFPSLVIAAHTVEPVHVGQRAPVNVWLNTSGRDLTQLLTWTSSKPTVATVHAGQLNAISPGTTELATSYEGLSTSFRYSVPPIRYPAPRP